MSLKKPWLSIYRLFIKISDKKNNFLLDFTVSVSTPTTGPALRLTFKVFSWLRKTDGSDVFLIDKVVLRDENGEVVSDALAVIVRVDSDGDHLGLLGLQQLIVRLDVVLPTPGIELALPGPDVVPVVRGLAFIPKERRDSVPGYYRTSTRLVHFKSRDQVRVLTPAILCHKDIVKGKNCPGMVTLGALSALGCVCVL